jgi:hypothetical protein
MGRGALYPSQLPVPEASHDPTSSPEPPSSPPELPLDDTAELPDSPPEHNSPRSIVEPITQHNDAVEIVGAVLERHASENPDTIMTDVDAPEDDAVAQDSEDYLSFFASHGVEETQPEAFEEVPADSDAPDSDEETQDDIAGGAPMADAASDSGRGGDLSEEVPHQPEAFDMSDFEVGICTLINKHQLPRSVYDELCNVLLLIKPTPPEILNLPKRIDTLKKKLRKQLPLLQMRKRQLHLDPTKLPTRGSHTEDLHMFDMRAVFSRMLQPERLLKRGHLDMAEFVDDPVEFYQSRSWSGSNRTTSGKFAMIKGREEILTSEFVWYTVGSATRLGRVAHVGRDRRSTAKAAGTDGAVILQLSPVATVTDVQNKYPNIYNDAASARPRVPSRVEEIFLVENAQLTDVVESQLIKREPRVFLDYSWATTGNQFPSASVMKYYVRQIISLGATPRIRKLALSHPHPGELEIKTYGRTALLSKLARSKHLVYSFPYTMFIDGFGVYRNMYRSIISMYVQFAFLNETERRRQINVFPLSLGPFGADWEDVVRSLTHLADLESGVEVTLDNGQKVIVAAPCLAYIGDMPQQQANSGCRSQNAEHFCRHCLVGKEDRANLYYNIVLNGRYHFEMIRCRQAANSKAEREKREIFQELGLAPKEPPLQALTPALDLFRSRPPDAVHSEWKGIARQMITLLFEDIIKNEFHDRFATEFAQLPIPPGWPRNQNIKRYHGSYSISEYGPASMMLPLVMRTWMQDIHVKPKFLAAMEDVLETRRDDSGHSGVDFIVHCYDMVAKSNAVFLGRQMHRLDKAHVHQLAIESRERYQDLLTIAADAASKRIAAAQIAVGKPRSRLVRSLSQSSASEREQEPGPRFGEEEEFSEASLTKKGVEAEEKRAEQLKRKMSTPNIHTILHFYDAVVQYASVLNVITLQGEDRHR